MPSQDPDLNLLTEGGCCPACRSRRLDRVDVITQRVLRRIEFIGTRGHYYQPDRSDIRPFSDQADRKGGGSGRHGEAIECADCGWYASYKDEKTMETILKMCMEAHHA